VLIAEIINDLSLCQALWQMLIDIIGDIFVG